MPTRSIDHACRIEAEDSDCQPSTRAILRLNNRQRQYRIDMCMFRPMAEWLLREVLMGRPYDIALSFLGPRVMGLVNQQFLGHGGPTDVITFDYRELAGSDAIRAEILICPAFAWTQAKMFGTTPGDELARYWVHGLLHLLGFDDGQSANRRLMKQEEERWMRRLRQGHLLAKLVARSRTSR